MTVDTLRYDAITGANARYAPFMTALSDSSVTFTNAFSTNDSTPASHFSILSGYVTGFDTPLDESGAGLPAQLSRFGYDTFGVAANGNLSPKLLRLLGGFNRYVCLYDVWQQMSPDERKPFQAEIAERLRKYHARDNDWNEVMLYASAPRVLARFNEQLASARQPFLGFVNLIEPHDPYLPAVPPAGSDPSTTAVDPDVRFRRLPQFLTSPATLNDSAKENSIQNRLRLADGRAWSLSDDLSPTALATYRARYQAEVTEADQAVRKLLATLDDRGLLDSTVVIITSDHGEAFGESGFITHSFRNGGDQQVLQHVPLLVALPGGREDSARIESLVTGADIAPTIYDLVGIDWRRIAQGSWVGNYGRSLLPLLGQTTKQISAAAAAPDRLTEPDLREKRRRTMERLRALGYVQ